MKDLHTILAKNDTHRIVAGRTDDGDPVMALQKRHETRGWWEHVETLSEDPESINAIAELYKPFISE